jgi:hypothetical protein
LAALLAELLQHKANFIIFISPPNQSLNDSTLRWVMFTEANARFAFLFHFGKRRLKFEEILYFFLICVILLTLWESIVFVKQFMRIFEVFMAVTMKNAVFWDVAPCSFWVNRRFGGTYCLCSHLLMLVTRSRIFLP